MTSTNLRKAEDAATGVSTIISVFVTLEIIGIMLIARDAPSEFRFSIIFIGIISIFGLLLFYYTWQSIYEVLMHIGSPLEEETSPLSYKQEETSPLSYKQEETSSELRRCKHFFKEGGKVRCTNLHLNEKYCDEHS